jgi:CRP-like cAMP-binding protein
MQEQWQDNLSLEEFNAKSILTLEKNWVWWIERGIVKTYTLDDDGTAINLGYWGAGDVIGESFSLTKPCHIKCLTDVKAFFVPVDECEPLIGEICGHVRQTEDLLCIMHIEDRLQRLWDTLRWLGDKFGTEVELGRLINLRLTHQELADTIGITRVTATKFLKQLENKGMISRPHRHEIILRRKEVTK